jgi:hypothetical protein
MESTYATPAMLRGTRRVRVGLVAVAVVTLAGGVGIAALNASGQEASSPAAIVRQQPGYGTGYPPHHGLAGPAGIKAQAEHAGYGADYPSHYGLAGASGVKPRAEHAGYGAHYPQHAGLAGPSGFKARAQDGGYGADYPQHGGLAGPSGAGSDR